MAKMTKEMRKALKDARKMMDDVARADGNEAETRRRVERIFEAVMGYRAFEHISREHAVRGAGETEHCDFAICTGGVDAKPDIMVELKRVNVDLAQKHLKQVASYAINAGCEWLLLTNGKEWKLYHVSFGQPPQTKQIAAWNLMENDLDDLRENFELINYRNVKRGGLQKLWEKASVLATTNLLEALLDADTIGGIRRRLRKSTGVMVSPEDIVAALRRLFNESALTELEGIKFSLPTKKKRRSRRTKSEAAGSEADDTDDARVGGEPPAAPPDAEDGATPAPPV